MGICSDSPKSTSYDYGELWNLCPRRRSHHLRTVFCYTAPLCLLTDHVSGHIDEVHQRNPSLRTQLNEVRRFECRGREEDTGIGNDPHAAVSSCHNTWPRRRRLARHLNARVTLNLCETSDDSLSVFRLELAELASVNDASYDFPHIKALPRVGGDDCVEISWRMDGWPDFTTDGGLKSVLAYTTDC